MNDEEIKKFVEKEVADAKLDVAEKRFRNLVLIAGAFLTIFGVVLPLYTTSSSSNKVDDAIKEMKNDVNYLTETTEKRIDKLEVKIKDEINYLKGEVKELSNEQKNNLVNSEKKLNSKISEYEDKFNSITKEAFRKPNLVCLIDDRPIGGTINLNRHKAFLDFKIVNQGDATANNIKIFAYIEEEKGMRIHGDFYNYSTIDIEGYLSHKYDYRTFSLDADQSIIIQFAFIWDKKIEKLNANVIIRIFYEQPKPTEYSFTINLE